MIYIPNTRYHKLERRSRKINTAYISESPESYEITLQSNLVSAYFHAIINFFCHHSNKVLTQMFIKQGSKFNGAVTHHLGLSKMFHQSSPDIKWTILSAIDMTKEDVDKTPHDLTVFIIVTRIPGRLF